MACGREIFWHSLLVFVAAVCLQASADEGPGAIDVAHQVRQILADRCFVCHGPDEGSRQSGLRLDRRENALAVAESGLAAITPGQPEQSQLLIRVASSDAELRMPPPESGPPLSSNEIGVLKQWIAAGAKYSEHWSFRPITRQPLPPVRDETWPENAIDCFILAQLERARVTPFPAPLPEKLLRRLHFDLSGLPPIPDEAVALAADKRRTPTSVWSINCWPRPILASVLVVIGSIWLITLTVMGTWGTHYDPTPGGTANGSSRQSTVICHWISLSLSSWLATCCRCRASSNARLLVSSATPCEIPKRVSISKNIA